MKKFAFVTCWGVGGYDKYAKRFLETWKEFVPWGSLTAYYHDCDLPEDAPKADNIRYVNLVEACPELTEWKLKNQTNNGQSPQGYNFRKDAIKFSHKVFALSQRGRELGSERHLPFLVWLDADIHTKCAVSQDEFSEIFRSEPDEAHLGRHGTYAETSFLAFNLYTEAGRNLLNDLLESYLSGEIFYWTEWHDGFIFSRLLAVARWKGLRELNLTPTVGGAGSDAFNNSPLGKWFVHLKGPVAKGEVGRQPIRIIPKDCVDHSDIHENIKWHLENIKQWISVCDFHQETAKCVSAGPSLENYLESLRGEKWIFSVKHSYPLLLRQGIVPKFCVILDPRNVDGISTHNIKRTTLFDVVHKDTIFFIASMTHPSVTKLIMEKGGNVVCWHALSDATRTSPLLQKDVMMITGGTCAALRAISISRTLGFRVVDLYGYDFSLSQEPQDRKTAKDELNRPKYLEVQVGEYGRKWWTTGEMLAGVQDIEALAKEQQTDITIRHHGDSFAGDRWKVDHTWRFPTMGEYLKSLTNN